MSNQDHALPGQSIIERLCARGNRRLNVGPSQAFYDRFGVTDPWHFDGQFDVAEDAEVFSFLSAAPYYQRVRAQQNAAVRARRRLMERLAGQRRHSSYLERASRRMTAATGSGRQTTWLNAPDAFGSANVDLVMIEAAPAVEDGVEEVEAAIARPVYRDRRRPLRRAAARATTPDNDAVIRELELLARGLKSERRQEVVEAARTIRSTPHARRASVVKQVERRLRGSNRRVVGSTMRRGLTEQSYTSADATPVERANSRAASVVGARSVAGRAARGLRPITSSSPMLATLIHEDIADQEAAAADAVPRSVERRRASVPASRRRASAHRTLPESAASREARTQRVTGRAGPLRSAATPLLESRGTTAAPSATMARRAASRFTPSALNDSSDRPTARLARVAQDVSSRSNVDVRRGVSAAGRADLVAVPSARAAGFDPVMALPAAPILDAGEEASTPSPSRRVKSRSVPRRVGSRRERSAGLGSPVGVAPVAAPVGRRPVGPPAAPQGRVRSRGASAVSGAHRSVTRAALRSSAGQFGSTSGLLAPAATDYVARSSEDGAVRSSRVASLRSAAREGYTRPARTALDPAAAYPLAQPALQEAGADDAGTVQATRLIGRAIRRPAHDRAVAGRGLRTSGARTLTASAAAAVEGLPASQRATSRVAARLARMSRTSGESLAVSPTAYVLASPEPVSAEEVHTPAASMARGARAATTARRSTTASKRSSADVRSGYAGSVGSRTVVRSARTGVEREARRLDRAVASSSVRAAARGVESKRRDDQGRRLFAPSSTGHVHNAARMASRPSTIADAVAPTLLASSPTESSVEAPISSSARKAKHHRASPTVRAASRAVQAPRVDALGRARLVSSPTDYLAVANAAPQRSLSRSASVARGESGVSTQVAERDARGHEASRRAGRSAAPSRAEAAVAADATLLASVVHSSSSVMYPITVRGTGAAAPHDVAESHSERLHRRLDAPAAAWDAPSAAPHEARVSRQVLSSDAAMLAAAPVSVAQSVEDEAVAPVARRRGVARRSSATRGRSVSRSPVSDSRQRASRSMWVKAPTGYRTAAPTASAAVHAAGRGVHAGRRVLRASPAAQPLSSSGGSAAARRLTAAPTGYAASSPDLSWLAGIMDVGLDEASSDTTAPVRRRAAARPSAASGSARSAGAAAPERFTGTLSTSGSTGTGRAAAQRSVSSVRAFERSEQPSLVSRASRRSLSMGMEPVFAALPQPSSEGMESEAPVGRAARRASGRTRAAAVSRRLNAAERGASYRSTERAQAVRARDDERMVQLAVAAGADEVQVSHGSTRRKGALERAENRGVHGASSAASPVVRTIRRAMADHGTPLASPSALLPALQSAEHHVQMLVSATLVAPLGRRRLPERRLGKQRPGARCTAWELRACPWRWAPL